MTHRSAPSSPLAVSAALVALALPLALPPAPAAAQVAATQPAAAQPTAGQPAAGQPWWRPWAGFTDGQRARPALAPGAGTAETRADGTTTTDVPRVVLTPSRPPARDPAGVIAPEPDGAATLLADHVELSGDRILTASGGVVVWFEGARLVAERVIYDGRAGTMTIEGPIHLTEPGNAGTPDEAVLVADSAQLDEGLRDGLLRGARLVLARELQLAAAEVQRTGNGRMTTLTHVVASSCQVCASDPTPLWEIRARRITHDAETRMLHFERPQFRAFGLPVGTLPAMSAPDPTVERMTGFLQPRFRTTSGLGFGVMLPYFITLGDSADLTVTPYVSASRTTTLGLRYRQAFTNGATEWTGAISRDDIEDGTRGYLFGAARFALPRGYRLGVQVQTASDRGYLLDYGVSDADRLWSGVTLDRIARDRMVTGRVGHYQTLREGERASTSPSLVADALWERRYAAFGGEAGLQFSVHAHRRSSDDNILGRDIARGSARLDWQRNWLLPGGVVAAAQTRLDADVYRIGDDDRFDRTAARAIPAAAVELRWPLVARQGAATHLLEPVAQIAWSPRLEDEDVVPNEDSRLIEFDEGNLYMLDRLPGRDSVEGGLRANLGLRWTRIDPTGWSLGVTAGRVLRDRPDPAFARGGGVLAGKRSDWLLAATYSDAGGLAIANRALFDDDFDINRNELRLGWLRPGFQLSAGYLWIDSQTIEGLSADVSELSATTGWQLAPGWWASAETRYDFAADRAQRADLGLTYRNECVSVDLSVSRRFTASDSLRPDTDLGLSVRLGGFGRRPDELPGTVARRACVR